jgi:trehalose synthase
MKRQGAPALAGTDVFEVGFVGADRQVEVAGDAGDFPFRPGQTGHAGPPPAAPPRFPGTISGVDGRRKCPARADHGTMTFLRPVPIAPRPAAALEPVIGGERYEHLLAAAARFRERLAGRTIWNVNSTAAGGGVAEMLRALLGYVDDLGVPIRWTVIGGDPDFFGITKRLHNQLHGVSGQGDLGDAEAEHYQQVLAANTQELLDLVRPGDIVLLHDPQTAGLTAAMARAGAAVVWRCHVGVDWQNDATGAAWAFLRPHLASAHGFVFSRRQYVPPWVPADMTWIIPPSIDPFSAKNQELDTETVRAILTTIGVLDHASPQVPARFLRADGTPGEVVRAATVTCDELPGPDDRVVAQISRWDRLKDMGGVMRGFADHAAPGGDGHLMLVGPAVSGVTDDPEGALVYAECLAQWQALPAAIRARVMLVTLPLDDVDENAAMVNGLQRHATVIAQKSLAEGFGLTVAEGMWKGRAVIGSAVGGIMDQIAEGTGVLLRDATDLQSFGLEVRALLDQPERAGHMGMAAQAYIRENYVGDVHLLRYATLFGTVIQAVS